MGQLSDKGDRQKEICIGKEYVYIGTTITPAASMISTPTQAATTNHWVGTWAASQQLTEPNNMPPSPGLSNNTLRQIVRVSIAGNKIRMKFSNQYGTSLVTMNSVHLAVSAGGSSIKADTDKVLTFGGKEAVTIPAGQTVFSDTLVIDGLIFWLPVYKKIQLRQRWQCLIKELVVMLYCQAD